MSHAISHIHFQQYGFREHNSCLIVNYATTRCMRVARQCNDKISHFCVCNVARTELKFRTRITLNTLFILLIGFLCVEPGLIAYTVFCIFYILDSHGDRFFLSSKNFRFAHLKRERKKTKIITKIPVKNRATNGFSMICSAVVIVSLVLSVSVFVICSYCGVSSVAPHFVCESSGKHTDKRRAKIKSWQRFYSNYKALDFYYRAYDSLEY